MSSFSDSVHHVELFQESEEFTPCDSCYDEEHKKHARLLTITFGKKANRDPIEAGCLLCDEEVEALLETKYARRMLSIICIFGKFANMVLTGLNVLDFADVDAGVVGDEGVVDDVGLDVVEDIKITHTQQCCRHDNISIPILTPILWLAEL